MKSNKKPLRVCVCTSYRGDREPRGPRHAAALAQLGSELEVIFVDCAPAKQPSSHLEILNNLPNLTWYTHFYPHRQAGVVKLLINRVLNLIAKTLFQIFGTLHPSAFNPNIIGLERILQMTKANVYIAHNIDTLLPTARVAHNTGALLMFDSMEFHADMGDSQTQVEQQMIHALESRCLPQCKLILASSEQVADELVKEYGIQRPLPLHNVPTIEPYIPPKNDGNFSLYWRNSVIGLGQRGLDEALVALSLLPEDITLHLQGRLPFDGGKALKTRINDLGLTPRVTFHPPYAPEEAVKMAIPYTIGLCMERKGVRNHDLTVSNKMFDYMMAGLVVIASDLPSLRHVIEWSQAGLLFQSGSSDDLARQIMSLYTNHQLLSELSKNARNFALSVGNREVEMKKFTGAFTTVCGYKFVSQVS